MADFEIVYGEYDLGAEDHKLSTRMRGVVGRNMDRSCSSIEHKK